MSRRPARASQRSKPTTADARGTGTQTAQPGPRHGRPAATGARRAVATVGEARSTGATGIEKAAAEFARLVEIMATLRGPGGCPWDREQTTDSLKPFVLEETYELLEAIDQQDHAALKEELGDFLFEAVFVAQLEREAGYFDIADAVRTVADKLVRRHPHVFARDEGEPPLETPSQVVVRWEEIKARERGGDGRAKTLLGGIPQGLPALLRAYQIGARAATVGFDWSRAGDVMAKIQEEVDEMREVVESPRRQQDRREEELGDLLFAIANLSRKLGVEPETALRKATVKFAGRFGAMEARAAAAGHRLRDLTADQLEREWERAKDGERKRRPRPRFRR